MGKYDFDRHLHAHQILSVVIGLESSSMMAIGGAGLKHSFVGRDLLTIIA